MNCATGKPSAKDTGLPNQQSALITCTVEVKASKPNNLVRTIYIIPYKYRLDSLAAFHVLKRLSKVGGFVVFDDFLQRKFALTR